MNAAPAAANDPTPTTAAAPAVELRDVAKSYPQPTAVTALEGVTLSIRLGETAAITGPSGSGKSTLLNLLGTLERPTRGTILIDGVDTAQLSDGAVSGLRATRIGFVFQQFQLLEHLSVLDNVATGLLYRGLAVRRRRAAAADALERVGLAARSSHRPSQLSGGEQQRSAIARAIVGAPSLVLADEPTGNLDSVTGREILDLLVALANPRTTILVISHDAGVAAAMHRQIQLRDGHVVDDSGAA